MEYLAFKQYLGKIFGVTVVTEDQTYSSHLIPALFQEGIVKIFRLL